MDEARVRRVMSGEARDLGARLLRPGLWLLSLAYRLGAGLHRGLYAAGLKRRVRAGLPVLCVGNLSAGGTGKTPMVALVCQRLAALGAKPGIVSRGYGSRSPGSGNDEAIVLEQLLPGVPHVQNPDRAAACAQVARQGAEVAVLDDGFSHHRLERELDILLFDASCPFGYGYPLPRGLLREPLGACRRAGLAVITRSDQVEAGRLAEIRGRLVRLGFADEAILSASHTPTELNQLAGPPLGLSEPASLAGKPVGCVAAIANPEAFARTLSDLGAQVVWRRSLRDHFAYPQGWLDASWPGLEAAAREAGAQALVVTQKDAVKLRERLADGRVECALPVLELRVSMRLASPEQGAALDARLQPLLAHRPPDA